MQRAGESIIHLPRRRMFSALELHAMAIGSIAAVVFFFGWGLQIEFLQSLIPGFPTMKARTAFALMMLSLAAMLSFRDSRWAQIASSVIAAGVAIWMIWLLIVYWDRSQPGTPQMLPIHATLLSLGLCGAAMLIVNLAPRWQGVAAVMVWLAITPALYRIFSLVLFWGAPVETGSLLSSQALHTALLILWFMIACILMHPRFTYADGLYEASLRGRLLRRAIPLVIGAPVFAAVASLVLTYAFGWEQEALFALAAAINVMVGASLIWWLSRVVAEWQTEANEHANRLQRANEALEQYASTAAHDLKAPVRHVLLYGELLDEMLNKGNIEGAKKHARSIRSAAGELPGMIDGMLEYSRSGFSRVEPANRSLSELVQAATTMLDGQLRAAGAKVIVEREATLWADAQLMTAVFQNLFVNSLKHRREDRRLEIRIDAERIEDRWEVSVTDNGVGFAPEFAVVAFNPLARGVKMAGDGAGIGLATCRTILHSHGGEIRVDATFREGARIEITLPARNA